MKANPVIISNDRVRNLRPTKPQHRGNCLPNNWDNREKGLMDMHIDTLKDGKNFLS